MQKSLKAYVDDTSKQEFVLEKTAVTPYEFYAPVNGKMSAYLVKPVTFDLMIKVKYESYIIEVFGDSYYKESSADNSHHYDTIYGDSSEFDFTSLHFVTSFEPPNSTTSPTCNGTSAA